MNSPEQVAEARAKALELMQAFNEGEMNLDRMLDRIVDVWTGRDKAIVRVGTETHKPEIQS